MTECETAERQKGIRGNNKSLPEWLGWEGAASVRGEVRAGPDQDMLMRCAKELGFHAEGSKDQAKAFKHGVMNKVAF